VHWRLATPYECQRLDPAQEGLEKITKKGKRSATDGKAPAVGKGSPDVPEIQEIPEIPGKGAMMAQRYAASFSNRLLSDLA
jgi:hypothetical protein